MYTISHKLMTWNKLRLKAILNPTIVRPDYDQNGTVQLYDQTMISLFMFGRVTWLVEIYLQFVETFLRTNFFSKIVHVA